MKKMSLMALTAAMTMALSSAAMAKKDMMGGGFVGPESNVKVVTVEEAKTMKDDARVVLRGYIENRVGDEDYMFKDSTGSIKVEIDKKKWKGLTVTPEDMVEIRGEVDTHMVKPTEIDVKSISLVPADK